MNEPDFLQRQSLSPSREKARSPADAMGLPLAKKIKKDEVTLTFFSSPITFHPQHPAAAVNGLVRHSPPKENGVDHKRDPVSPPSGHSSASSTPAPSKKNGDDGKPPTPKSGGHRSPPSLENGSPTLKGLPGPPYGLPGFPPPPGLPANGSGPPPPDAPGYPRPPYDPAHPALRPSPALGLGNQPATAGKPYVVSHFIPSVLAGRKEFKAIKFLSLSKTFRAKSDLFIKLLPTRPEQPPFPFSPSFTYSAYSAFLAQLTFFFQGLLILR